MDIKMSDVFNLPLYTFEDSVMCQGVTKINQPHPDLHLRATLYAGDESEVCRHITHAINTHDQHVEEIRELREALKYFVDRVEAGTIRSKTTYEMYKRILEGKGNE